MIANLVKWFIRKYSDIIAVYEELSSGYIHWRVRPWDIIKLVRGKYIADLGSGHCVQGSSIVSEGRSVYTLCLDLSPSMLAKGKIRFKDLMLDFIASDALAIPLRSRSINALLTIAALHHLDINELVRALSEIRRVVHSGGIILITTWSPWQSRFLVKLIAMYLMKVLDVRIHPREFLIPWRSKSRTILRCYVLYSLKELINVVKKLGFKVISSGYFRPYPKGSSNIYIIALNP